MVPSCAYITTGHLIINTCLSTRTLYKKVLVVVLCAYKIRYFVLYCMKQLHSLRFSFVFYFETSFVFIHKPDGCKGRVLVIISQCSIVYHTLHMSKISATLNPAFETTCLFAAAIYTQLFAYHFFLLNRR